MPRPHRRGHLPAPLPLSPSKQTFVIAFAMSLKCHIRTHAVQQNLFNYLVGEL
jgi:hypothetical protein